MRRCRYRGNCVSTPHEDLPKLNRMIEQAEDVTRQTFLKHVDRDDLRDVERQLGYDRHMAMVSDPYVSYCRSTWGPVPCYFFVWSAIEYYFVEE